jgi:hypothetical protein
MSVKLLRISGVNFSLFWAVSTEIRGRSVVDCEKSMFDSHLLCYQTSLSRCIFYGALTKKNEHSDNHSFVFNRSSTNVLPKNVDLM